jgi:hypothetical protein
MPPARPTLNHVRASTGGPQQPVSLPRRGQLLTDARDPPSSRTSRDRSHLTLDHGTRTSVARHVSLASGAGQTGPSTTTSHGDGGSSPPKSGKLLPHLGHLMPIWGTKNPGRLPSTPHAHQGPAPTPRGEEWIRRCAGSNVLRHRGSSPLSALSA